MIALASLALWLSIAGLSKSTPSHDLQPKGNSQSKSRITLPVDKNEHFRRNLEIQYDKSCSVSHKSAFKAAQQPRGMPVPHEGRFYGFNSYHPDQCISQNFNWYLAPSHTSQCKPAPPMQFPPKKDCTTITKWQEYVEYKKTASKACVILENLVAEGPMIFEMPEKSFFGCRGTIMAPVADPKLFKPKFIDYTAGKDSVFAGDGCLIYMRGEAYFTGVKNEFSWRAIDIAKVDGLHVNGINIIQANAPNWHVTGQNIVMEDCNVIVASDQGYPPLSRNSDAFQIGVNNFTLRNSFIQSGDDAIALKQTNGATFECLNIFYSHGLSIGSVSEGNVVQNVVFKDIELTAPEYAVRIKAKKFSTGLVQNVYYTNILAHQANVTAIGIRDDYLDPDADFKPDSDVMIKGIHFTDFTATVKNRDPEFQTSSIMVLCSAGSKTKGGCEDLNFNRVSIKGSDMSYPPYLINYHLPRVLESTGIDVDNFTTYLATGKIDPPPKSAKSGAKKSATKP